ncbi:MAG: hypothetical protein HY303_05080 [Candidatus Wallbacteria bacterium]|nr:hypothetical protein [Candidatus Wallbacteria bacterium]
MGLVCAAVALAYGTPDRFALTNVSSDNATVVWLSADVEAGRVEFAELEGDLASRTGTFATATDDAGPGRVHHVTLGEAALFDNRPPVASAGPGLPGVAGQPVTLEGTASDPDGDALTYRWTANAQNPAVASLVNDTSPRPTLTPSIV